MRWDQCISVGGGYVEKCFFPGSNITRFYVLYPFVTCLLTLPRSYAAMSYFSVNKE
jgi:hypothetical protein